MPFLRRQHAGNDCGPTCFANMLNLLGYNITIPHANKVCRLTRGGTDANDLIRAFQKFGFCGDIGEFDSDKKAWRWVVKQSSLFYPVIVSILDDTHWILVLSANQNYAQIIDPDVGKPEKLDKVSFLTQWKYEEDGESEFFGISFYPIKPKAEKAISLRKELNKTKVRGKDDFC